MDVGYGDAVQPPPVSIDYPSILQFAAPHIRAYSRYTVVAEKLQAAAELGLTNSRLKDFFDLFTLAARFDFDGQQLVEAITATFARRGVAIPAEPPAAFSTRFSEAPDKLAQWKGFLKRARVRIEVPPFPGVVESVARFAREPLESARDRHAFARIWRPAGPWAKADPRTPAP